MLTINEISETVGEVMEGIAYWGLELSEEADRDTIRQCVTVALGTRILQKDTESLKRQSLQLEDMQMEVWNRGPLGIPHMEDILTNASHAITHAQTGE